MESTAEDRKFIDENGVSVSRSRFMVSGQTYAMSGITSVKSYQQNPNRAGPIILGSLGLLGLAMGLDAFAGAVIAIGIAIAWWVLSKPKYSVLLSSASGEVKALTSTDGPFIARVINALNDAIVHRG